VTYDEGLADRIRSAVEAAAGSAGYREIKMFGGLCWTVNTHMAVGTGDDDLMVYVGKEALITRSRTAPDWQGWGIEPWAVWFWLRRRTFRMRTLLMPGLARR
jgi:hypothetical protein